MADVAIRTLMVDIQTFMVYLIWDVISAPWSFKSPSYNEILASENAIAALAGLAQLDFHPDLFRLLTAESPPDLDHFKSIPATLPDKGLWGVYFLILEKNDEKPLLYVGSRTSVSRGVRGRFLDHLAKHSIPSLVQEAYDNGYELTHHGILVTCPIPQPGDVFLVRLIVIAIEAVLTWTLWALPQPHLWYGLPTFGPWDRHSLTYGGACSHNPLLDAVRGDDRVASLEELADRKAERLRYKKEWKNARDPEKKKADADRGKERWKARDPEKKKADADRGKRWREARDPEKKKADADRRKEWRKARTPEKKKADADQKKERRANWSPDQRKVAADQRKKLYEDPEKKKAELAKKKAWYAAKKLEKEMAASWDGGVDEDMEREKDFVT